MKRRIQAAIILAVALLLTTACHAEANSPVKPPIWPELADCLAAHLKTTTHSGIGIRHAAPMADAYCISALPPAQPAQPADQDAIKECHRQERRAYISRVGDNNTVITYAAMHYAAAACQRANDSATPY